MTLNVPFGEQEVQTPDADRELQDHASPKGGQLFLLRGVEGAEVVEERDASGNAKDEAEYHGGSAMRCVRGDKGYRDKGDVEDESE